MSVEMKKRPRQIADGQNEQHTVQFMDDNEKIHSPGALKKYLKKEQVQKENTLEDGEVDETFIDDYQLYVEKLKYNKRYLENHGQKENIFVPLVHEYINNPMKVVGVSVAKHPFAKLKRRAYIRKGRKCIIESQYDVHCFLSICNHCDDLSISKKNEI